MIAKVKEHCACCGKKYIPKGRFNKRCKACVTNPPRGPMIVNDNFGNGQVLRKDLGPR